ncbi:DHHA1 domain-containing protein [Bacillus sp. AFS041924]|uniref:alanyl-tRNA editing protein n=1 Tax=Bacillus sp. AFS041924 TaxID=2033503 RepID=UPI000BFD7D93|nr:DHHA1 domain-containing protein [Bacillus sp. AFS041924]PGS53426.1 alanyl-tRNA editing protein [Bacillus sp. AFS041924]
MANKLYFEQPSLKNWMTKITEIKEVDSLFHIKLEDSAFYPEGGGQPSDFGKIDGIEIIELIEDHQEVIHVLKEKPTKTEVNCEINWERRVDHMQHHSGQHLLSATIIELFDIPTVSFHLGKETVTIDLDTPSLSSEQLIEIERAVYEKILANIEIKTYFVNKDELNTLQLRKLPKVEENIRIVEILHTDVSACCGTHIKQTGEIGLLKLLKTEKVRQTTRLHFKCGFRALEEIQKTTKTVTNINQLFNSHTDLVVDKIEQTMNELKEAQKEIEKMKGTIFDSIANELLSNATNDLIIKSFKEESVKDLQLLAKAIQAKKPSLLVFLSGNENKLLVINQLKNDLHCGDLIKNLLKQVEGKGGGGAQQAQATFETSIQLNQAEYFLKSILLPQVNA